jgi:capsular polysaccharide biosynthesis protein
MIKIIIGFLLGVVVATVGFSGIARLLDNGVQSIQQTSKELAQ